jgi:hypothetical protein
MANQITDNRTSIAVAQTSAPASETWEASGGGGSITEDTDIFIQGTTSVAEQITSTRRVMLYDNGTDLNLANGHLYIWVNCGIVGLLDTKANGGLTIRFTGATSTDFFEFEVGGSDSWPTAVQGGWVMFVVDTEATPSATGGTPPATSAVRKVGITAVTGGTMTKTVDNTWVDAIWFLGDGNPGIIVEGRNAGTTDWNSADIVTQLGSSTGMFKPGPGGTYVINAPIQFGINDTSTHGFTDTNAVWLWETQEFAATDLYSISALGNSGGTTNVTFGVKTGTGADATGAQGLIITAESTAVRWAMDFDDPDLDSIGLYGCQFIHGGTFQLDDAAVDLASCLFLDCTQAQVSNATIVRASVVDANTADGTAFMITDDFGDIANCSFEFSDGHAIEITSTAVSSQNNVGNSFAGYTNSVNSTDAAILHSSAGSLTINSSGGSNLNTNSYRNTGGGSVTINNNVSTTLSGLVNPTEVRVYSAGTTTELAGQEDVTTGSFVFSLGAATNVDIRIFAVSYEPADILGYTVGSSDTTIPVQQRFDRNYSNP